MKIGIYEKKKKKKIETKSLILFKGLISLLEFV